MHWFFLILAIILEVAGTTSMKLSEGFSKLIPSLLIFIFYGLCFTALTFALKKIDVSIAYTVWAGIGTTLIVTVGILYFKEPATALKIISIGLIIIGVIGLHFSGGVH